MLATAARCQIVRFALALLSVAVLCEQLRADVQPAVAKTSREPAIAPIQPVAAEEPAKYKLAYKFPAGETLRFVIDHASTFTTRKGEVSDVAYHRSTTKQHLRVESVAPSGEAVIEAFIDHVKMTVKFNDEQPTEYDSASGVEPPTKLKRVHDTIGKPLVHLRIAPNGKLIDATPLLDWKSQKELSVPTGTVSLDNDPSKNFLVVFPEQPIAVGEEWRDTLTIEVQATGKLFTDVQILRIHTLKSVENGIATIELKTSLLTAVNDPAMRARLIQNTPKGTIQFDLNRGLIVSRTTKVDEREVGFAGDDSFMHAVSERIERLVPAEKTASATPKPVR